MDRRDFLRLSGRAAGAMGVAACVPRPVQAALSCYPVHSAKSRCSAGLNDTPPIAAQPCQGLSWATCLCYVLSGYGAKICEKSILARYGMPDSCAEEATVGANELMAAAGIWKDDYGRRFLVKTERLPDLRRGLLPLVEAQRIITRLTRQPVLSGAAGYTTLLTEFTYEDGAMTRLQLKSATVRDPWTETKNLRQLSVAELSERSYLISLSVRAL